MREYRDTPPRPASGRMASVDGNTTDMDPLGLGSRFPGVVVFSEIYQGTYVHWPFLAFPSTSIYALVLSDATRRSDIVMD
jgi:hypothetical protein